MSPADLTDEQLGRAALAGDREAFAELFGRHERGLYNVAFRLTGDREDAADITQEAFLRVFARIGDLAGREVNLPAYLHRTARNLVYDRSARRARETPVDELVGAAGADESMDADPQLTAVVGAQGDEVRAANARLPERHRLVLALRELEDMSYGDIGRVLDVTPGAVAQLLARARMALRRELRLEQVDAGALDPACRARLGDIGALIDGELDPDRAQVLTAHMATCAACQSSRAAFEDARVTYRAWLPLPVLLGLGAETARAAEARGLVRFRDGDGREAGALGRGAAGGGLLAGRRRVAAAAVALLLIVGVSTVVGVRSTGGDPAPSSPVPEADAEPAPTASTGAAAGTAPAATTAPGAATAAGSAGVIPAAPGATAAAATVALPARPDRPATTARPRTTRRTPTVTQAGEPVAPPGPGTTTAAEPPPPVTTDTPPVVTDPPREPPPCTPGAACDPNDPGTTTGRVPVPPVTTSRVPPVLTIRDPTHTVR
ncbi:MAG: sigma-70 family RNA polymerase sigma factor [Thermoleophilia bacterium]